ncbi:MAG: hypothetical protein AAFU85_27080, partial [Planctomycetota bacterium]
MKLFVMLYLAAGGLLAFAGLRLYHGNFNDWQPVIAWTAGLNALTLLFVYLLFKPREVAAAPGVTSGASASDPAVDLTGDRIVFILSYAIGLGS